MELSSFYPSPKDLIKEEVAVLEYLTYEPYIQEKHAQFARDARNCYELYKDGHKNGFQFFSWFDIWHEGLHKNKKVRKANVPNGRLVIAARIELTDGSFSHITYCLSVCRHNKGFTILRKFHFDIVTSSSTSKTLQPHPRCHLQYCGKMLPQMLSMGCRDAQLTQMHPWLSEPRIGYWPISLALLIDMVLHEFPDSKSLQFRHSSEWQGIVKTHENLLLRPFYERCIEVIKNNGKKYKKKTLAEELYVD